MTKAKDIVSVFYMKNVKEIFKDFLNALASQDGEAAQAFYHDDATIFFREGSYYGKFQIKMILQNTFSIIKDETFDVKNLNWNFQSDQFATCTFEYNWTGTIQGKQFVTPGRGSLAWVCTDGDWKIILEHFGPMPN